MNVGRIRRPKPEVVISFITIRLWQAAQRSGTKVQSYGAAVIRLCAYFVLMFYRSSSTFTAFLCRPRLNLGLCINLGSGRYKIKCKWAFFRTHGPCIYSVHVSEVAGRQHDLWSVTKSTGCDCFYGLMSWNSAENLLQWPCLKQLRQNVVCDHCNYRTRSTQRIRGFYAYMLMLCRLMNSIDITYLLTCIIDAAQAEVHARSRDVGLP